MIKLTNVVARVAPQQVGPVNVFLGPGAYAFVGRTTDGVALLLETIAGRTRPTSGKVEVLNVAPSSAKARQAIGYVAADAPLPEILSVAATLKLASKLRGEPVVDASERLAKVGIEPLVHRRISSLSLAERRAVAFAEAVTSTKTQILLVDEPLVHMDARAVAGVTRLLRQKASQGACVVMTTASTQDPLLLASEAMAFDRGKLIWRGKPADRLALARGQAVRVTITATDVRVLGAALARDERAVRVTVEEKMIVAEGTTLVDICAAIATAARHSHVGRHQHRPRRCAARRSLRGDRRREPQCERATRHSAGSSSADLFAGSRPDEALVIALVQLALVRLVKSPRAWASAAFWMLVAVGVAGYVKRHSGGHGADEVLPGIFGTYSLPLIVFSLVGGIVAATSLRASVRPAIALGATGSSSAVATVLVVAGVSALVCAGLGAGLVPLSGAPYPLKADIVTSAWISALGAATYASFFVFGASFGKNGGGRTAFFVFDWLFGSTGSIFEVATPSAHLRNLLGGAPIKHVSQTASAVTLGVVAIVCLLLSARRAR